MNVCLIQTNIAWGDVSGNLRQFETLAAQAAPADLYVLPEMFTTGFATSAGALVETEPADGLEWMKAFAKMRGAAVCGSVALKLAASENCVNRMYFVTPDGGVRVYDKKHLFGYGGERDRFSAGIDRVTVEYDGVRFMLAVCYDLRFPVWLRNRGDYDVLIVSANWPEGRRRAWDVLTKARAIENQCYVLAVNRTGSDPSCNYDGGTAVVGPSGEMLASVPDNTAGCCSAQLDIKGLAALRRDFPVLDDADAFTLLP